MNKLFLVVLCTTTIFAGAQNAPIGVAYQFSHSANMDPSFSPDGKELVFISIIAGKQQVLRMGVDGSNPVQLTGDDAEHEDPAWSPDGKYIAFVLIRKGSKCSAPSKTRHMGPCLK